MYNNDCVFKGFDIEKLDPHAKDLSENNRYFFTALAKAASERQEEFFRYVGNNICSSLSDNVPDCTICTAVLPSGSQPDEGLFPVLEDAEELSNIVFIDREISQIPAFETTCRAIIDETQQITLKLKRTDILVKAEQIAADLFSQYNIAAPRIYSPYSRRAFCIENAPDLQKHTVRFEDKDIFMGQLYWNINLTPANRLSADYRKPSEVTVGGQRFLRFRKIDKDSFRVVCGNDTDISFIKHNGTDHIDILTKDYQEHDIEFASISLGKVSDRVSRQFRNTVRKDVIAPSRIRTKADIADAVRKFYPFPEEYTGFSAKTNGDTIKDYPSGYKYRYNSVPEIARANKNYCYLCFENKNHDIFLEDRVNYFISFMRYNYPEFYWVGVR